MNDGEEEARGWVRGEMRRRISFPIPLRENTGGKRLRWIEIGNTQRDDDRKKRREERKEREEKRKEREGRDGMGKEKGEKENESKGIAKSPSSNWLLFLKIGFGSSLGLAEVPRSARLLMQWTWALLN